MKKILFLFICASFMLNGCFISRIFSKKEKVGCPTNGRNVGAEKILAGDEKAIKAEKKAKYKGRKSLNPN
ncbi:MAG TPA: hypothetical protein PKC54_09325 [Ferruginibacter sp.]|nr:hypothetical protein [Ferruginibacter sp.]